VTLGRSGVQVAPLGLGSSFGVSGTDVERAVERGVNFLYWGSLQRPGFGAAIRRLARRRRDDLVVVVQSFTRARALLGFSVEQALLRLGIERADFLCLGWWNHAPPRPIVDAALALRERGRVQHLMLSGHQRKLFPELANDPAFDAFMVRYSAAHPGAEEDVFPHLATDRPGMIAYTATSWGRLPNPRLTPPGDATPRGSDCYRFALSHSQVDVVLAGPKNGEELDEALAALDRGPMTAEELAWMKRVGASVKKAGVLERVRSIL
jgi:aryl-alcohol dehydrogenase-like predicted oxidoreductase